MNNNDIKYIFRIILNFLIVGLIIFIVVKLFIFLLPVILILILGYYIYILYKHSKVKIKEVKENKKNKVPDAEIIDEKFDN